MIHAAVLGSPISHSLSPHLHNRAYRELGISGRYEAVDVTEAKFVEFIEKARDQDWSGFSLTMPHKERVLSVADRIDAIAQQIGSANLVLFDSKREISVQSTDVIGFITLLSELPLSKNSSVTIIGAGGTARAALFALDNRVAEITVISRSDYRTAALKKCVLQAKISIVAWSELSKFVGADLIINTTPSESTPTLLAAFGSRNHSNKYLLDAVYAPWPRETNVSWQSHHGHVIDGTELLICQAIPQIRLMTGQVFDELAMRSILRQTIEDHFHKN